MEVVTISLSVLVVVWGVAFLAGMMKGNSARESDEKRKAELGYENSFLASLGFVGGVFGMLTLHVLLIVDLITAAYNGATPSAAESETYVEIVIMFAYCWIIVSAGCASVLILQYYAEALQEHLGTPIRAPTAYPSPPTVSQCRMRRIHGSPVRELWPLALAQCRTGLMGCLLCCGKCRSDDLSGSEVAALRAATVLMEARGSVTMWLQSVPLLTIAVTLHAQGYTSTWSYLKTLGITGAIMAGYLWGQGQHIGRYYSPYRCSPNDREELPPTGPRRHVMVALLMCLALGLLSASMVAAAPAWVHDDGGFVLAYWLAFLGVPLASPLVYPLCRRRCGCPDFNNQLADHVEGAGGGGGGGKGKAEDGAALVQAAVAEVLGNACRLGVAWGLGSGEGGSGQAVRQLPAAVGGGSSSDVEGESKLPRRPTVFWKPHEQEAAVALVGSLSPGQPLARGDLDRLLRELGWPLQGYPRVKARLKVCQLRAAVAHGEDLSELLKPATQRQAFTRTRSNTWEDWCRDAFLAMPGHKGTAEDVCAHLLATPRIASRLDMRPSPYNHRTFPRWRSQVFKALGRLEGLVKTGAKAGGLHVYRYQQPPTAQEACEGAGPQGAEARAGAAQARRKRRRGPD
ncbi:hypothetical protein HYH03_012285 [Edaphochlamys debaryana]|uniref:Uncharacterized protein n=1 Tax=Edaphochlamys debaryana TaxID=47281 RepID=A0A836BUC3_9CHLO|nr:hypothetical protein HYH03_012285 [Edaphochlamys debaryana]|eukprot:KAG2489265.1 hypothetical protein HYH03_012285 [Edaphochlamys debaryana]